VTILDFDEIVIGARVSVWNYSDRGDDPKTIEEAGTIVALSPNVNNWPRIPYWIDVRLEERRGAGRDDESGVVARFECEIESTSKTEAGYTLRLTYSWIERAVLDGIEIEDFATRQREIVGGRVEEWPHWLVFGGWPQEIAAKTPHEFKLHDPSGVRRAMMIHDEMLVGVDEPCAKCGKPCSDNVHFPTWRAELLGWFPCGHRVRSPDGKIDRSYAPCSRRSGHAGPCAHARI
jgi:hypothetical protein